MNFEQWSAAEAAAVKAINGFAKLGIRVNCIAPGNILFPGGTWERHLQASRDEVMQMIDAKVPIGRFGTPEEIADLAAFLCSDAASFITGACFRADGGQTNSY